MFETLDGTALASKDHYTAVKKAIIFDANETEQQVKIHVNDDEDDDITENLKFSCQIIPVSDRVLITDGKKDVFIENPIQMTITGVQKGAAGDYHRAKISFALGEYLCRLSEKSVKVEIKRIRKMEKTVTCRLVPSIIQGDLHPNTPELLENELEFGPEVKTIEVDFPLPLLMSDQVVAKLELSEFGANAGPGSLTECEVNIINDKHAGVVGFSVPEMTFPVSEKSQNIGLIRAGGTDGPLSVTISAIDDSAQNNIHFVLPDETVVSFEDGQYQAALPISFISGNHGKMVSRRCTLKLTSISGMGQIGQKDCLLQLLTDQAPCSVSFARPEFSFMAGSGDQRLPLLRIGCLENPAEITWRITEHPDELGHLPTEGTVKFRGSENRTTLVLPSELLDLTINKKFKMILETIDTQVAVNLGKYHQSVIRVVSGLEPGSFEFRKTRAVCRQNDGKIDLPIVRQGGSDGIVNVEWSTSSELSNYADQSGVIEFAEGVHEQILTLEIDPEMESETDIFQAHLVTVSAGLVGPRNTAHVSVLKETEDVEFEFSTGDMTTPIGAIDAELDIIVKDGVVNQR